MGSGLRRLSLLLTMSAFSVAGTARADTHATAPAGGGLPALDVKVDLAGGAVEANGARVPITLDEARRPPEKDVVVEAMAIGRGRHVVHVRVPEAEADAGGLAWEAIFVPGRAEPVFAGITGLVSGDPGERTGKAVQIVPAGDKSFVLVGDVREDLSICGQTTTLLDPLALYPATMDLRPATVQRLSAEQREAAQPIVATDKGPHADPPLARLLVARGSSVPGSRGVELTDGDPRTVWTERRPGMGQGEFVVMAAPRDAPITRMQVVPSAPGGGGAAAAAPSTDRAGDHDAAAPRSFYLVTTDDTYRVTLPGDASLKPGESYEIAFPRPLQTSCVALVLDDAYTRGLPHPDVGVAELYAYSEFDAPGATLDDVAAKLSSPRGIAAAQVLERAGDPALAAVEKAYDRLDARGRALAIDVAASHEHCGEAAPLLARGLCEGEGEAPRKAREKLERCPAAAPVLAEKLRTDAASRACVAPTLAGIAPQQALEPIADAMAATPESDRDTRLVLRAAFGEALKSASPGRLASLLGDARRSAAARLEMMLAAKERVAEAAAQSEATIAELLRGSPVMRTRYLVLDPLGELAHVGDRDAAGRLAFSIDRDPDWPVRAHAAELSAGVPDAQDALVRATRDAAPRVREAALQSLAGSTSPPAVDAASSALSSDGWSFVKAQAIGVLARAPASKKVDEALGGALHDRSARVRGAALVALARQRASGYGAAIRERLDDKNEDADVRAAAARALGAVCDTSSADRLTELARTLGTPAASEDDQEIALGALVGLAALQPRDLRDRLAPLLGPHALPHVRAAARQALSARGACPAR